MTTGRIQILHLEDDPQDAQLVASLLAADHIDADIVRVQTRDDFLSQLRRHSADVIIADYNLPQFDGLVAQEIAAEMAPLVPFIFLSGTLGEDVAVERLKAGATDYVIKQRMTRLPTAVRRALAETAARTERLAAQESIRQLNADLERRVRDATSLLEDLIAASPSMIFRLDPSDFRITFASPNVGWLLGFSIEEMTKPAFWEAQIHADDHASAVRDLRGAMADHVAQIEQEYRVRNKDGTYRWLFSLSRVEYGEHGSPVAMLRYCLDIGDRKAAEEEVREANRFLDSVVENIPAMIFVKDARDLRIMRMNRAGEELTGLSRDALIGRTAADLFSAERAATINEQDMRVIQGRTLVDIPDDPLLSGSGELRVFHTKKIPLCDESGQPKFLLGISQDITDRMRADAEIRAARVEAERANRAKSEFVSRMSHDLRTPLNAILGFAQLLDDDDLNSEQKENVQLILRGGEHLLGLINEVLDIARIEAGQLSLSPETVGVHEIVRHAVELIGPLAAARQIAVRVEADDDSDLAVMVDRQRLNQLLLNLLSNAVKYNREGGRVTVSFERFAPGRLRIKVTDTGRGIPPEKLKLLFTPFERLGAEATGIEGTGLGLAVSRALATAMGGTLGVDSIIDEGTTFWLDVAIGECAAPTVHPEPSSASIDVSGVEGTILYVEDNPSNVRLMERLMQRRPQVSLQHAPTGGLGVEMATRSRPRMVLLDLHLPDMHGEDVLRQLMEDPELRSIPVAVLSADATPEQARRLLAAGAVAYLTKPLDVRKVLAVIDDVLGRTEPVTAQR